MFFGISFELWFVFAILPTILALVAGVAIRIYLHFLDKEIATEKRKEAAKAT